MAWSPWATDEASLCTEVRRDVMEWVRDLSLGCSAITCLFIYVVGDAMFPWTKHIEKGPKAQGP
jgi:hypothetical protein